MEPPGGWDFDDRTFSQVFGVDLMALAAEANYTKAEAAADRGDLTKAMAWATIGIVGELLLTLTPNISDATTLLDPDASMLEKGAAIGSLALSANPAVQAAKKTSALVMKIDKLSNLAGKALSLADHLPQGFLKKTVKSLLAEPVEIEEKSCTPGGAIRG